MGAGRADALVLVVALERDARRLGVRKGQLLRRAVAPAGAAAAIQESIDAGIELITCITEGVPVMDMVQIKEQELMKLHQQLSNVF